MDREEVNHDRLEQSLRQFTPRASSVDRDRLMFLAGQQSVSGSSVPKRSHWLWPAATLSMSTVAACFAVAFVWQLSQPTQVRIVVREVPVAQAAQSQIAKVSPEPKSTPVPPIAAAPISLALPASSLLQMRNVALRFGVDALPAEQRSYNSSAMPPTPIDRWHHLRGAAPDSDSSL